MMLMRDVSICDSLTAASPFSAAGRSRQSGSGRGCRGARTCGDEVGVEAVTIEVLPAVAARAAASGRAGHTTPSVKCPTAADTIRSRHGCAAPPLENKKEKTKGGADGDRTVRGPHIIGTVASR